MTQASAEVQKSASEKTAGAFVMKCGGSTLAALPASFFRGFA